MAKTRERAEKGHDRTGHSSFLCSVVPLSLAIQQLEISAVDLLKVDVEGDELAVLHGIDDDDWPKIRQVRHLEIGQRHEQGPWYLEKFFLSF